MWTKFKFGVKFSRKFRFYRHKRVLRFERGKRGAQRNYRVVRFIVTVKFKYHTPSPKPRWIEKTVIKKWEGLEEKDTWARRYNKELFSSKGEEFAKGYVRKMPEGFVDDFHLEEVRWRH